MGSIIPRAHTASSSAADNSAAGERRGRAVSVVDLQDRRNSFELAGGGARGTADGDGDTPSRAHRPVPLPLALTAGIGMSWSQQHLPPHPGPDYHAGTCKEHQPRVAASAEEAALVRRRRIALTPGARVAVIIGDEMASVKSGHAVWGPHVFGVVQELLPQDGHVRVRLDEGGCVLRVPHEMAWVVCSACSKDGDGLRACERCHRAFYCGKECQAKAWPKHKRECGEQAYLEAVRAELIRMDTDTFGEPLA